MYKINIRCIIYIYVCIYRIRCVLVKNLMNFMVLFSSKAPFIFGGMETLVRKSLYIVHS